MNVSRWFERYGISTQNTFLFMTSFSLLDLKTADLVSVIGSFDCALSACFLVSSKHSCVDKNATSCHVNLSRMFKSMLV